MKLEVEVWGVALEQNPGSQFCNIGCLPKVDNINHDQEDHSKSSCGFGQALMLWSLGTGSENCPQQP